MEYTKQECVTGFKIRWFIENCCEIKLPGGKTIVIDPMLVQKAGEDANHWEKDFQSGFGVEDLEGCDYVLITHIHGDHITSLKEVWDKFHPIIVVNGYSAYELAERFDIPPGAMIPASDGGEYNFDTFRVKWLPGRHTQPISLIPHSEAARFGPDPVEQRHGTMGSLYNNNFLITLPGNLKIAMDSGLYEPYLAEWEKYTPHLILRHKERGLEKHRDNFAAVLQRSGAQYIFSLCQQNTEGMDAIARATNEKLAELGCAGRMILPEPGRWYRFDLCCTAE